MNESYQLLQDFTDSVDELFSLFVRWMNPQGKTPTHKHDFIELVIVFSGSGDHEYGGQVIKVQKGDIFVIPRGKYHRYGTCSPDFAVMNILYIPESISMPLLDFTYLPGYEALYLGKVPDDGTCPLFHPEEKDMEQIRELALGLQHESENRTPGYLFNMMGLFMSLLGHLARIYPGGHHSAKKLYLNTAGVITYLNRNYRKTVSIARLCSIAGMSKASLMRNFARATGTTPLQYQMRLRIADAVMMLRSTEKCLADIAYETGFSDSNYFGRQFKRVTGRTPGAYRKKPTESDDSSGGN